MQVIDFKAWVSKDLIRVKKEIDRGNKNKSLPKRADHIYAILVNFARNDPNTVSFSATPAPEYTSLSDFFAKWAAITWTAPEDDYL